MDKHAFYQQAVQCVEAEIDFVTETFQQLRCRPAVSLREDFCGTAQTTCEWVARDSNNLGYAVDFDPLVLQWGEQNNVSRLTPEQQQRIHLINEDVLTVQTAPMDMVLAMNFSYFIFMTRADMRCYFQSVYQSLAGDGVFFLDAFGGYEAAKELTEERVCDGFTYIWEQATFNPINSQMQCYIHFITDEGVRMDQAFSYHWRLWTLPEISELLTESGFAQVDVYWEGTDKKTGEGNDVYTASQQGTADAGWVCYIVAQK
ncbi:MAG: class I SAM-dependent methyltransferase [Proteobacteria bacterium]|nr:MAG: class I SAM-dependent methyltransferase [Pseudomonadota bacterium]